MRTFLLSIVTALSLTAAADAQTASFTRYGVLCNANAFSVTGVPKLGGSFTVNGILAPLACTRKLCQNCNDFCNSCSNGSILAVGLKRLNVSWPPGTRCRLHTDALVLLSWSLATRGSITFNVPNNSVLLGQKFTMQRADLTYRGTNIGCTPPQKATGIVGMSEGMEGLIGK